MLVEKLECSFLIPEKRDSETSDCRLHRSETWSWLEIELQRRFGGRTEGPGLYPGEWVSSTTGEIVPDRSKKYFIDLPLEKLPDLRSFLAIACDVFQQQCIRLVVAGVSEFVNKSPIQATCAYDVSARARALTMLITSLSDAADKAVLNDEEKAKLKQDLDLANSDVLQLRKSLAMLRSKLDLGGTEREWYSKQLDKAHGQIERLKYDIPDIGSPPKEFGGY